MFWKIYDRLEWMIGLVALSLTVLAVLVAGIGRSVGSPVTSAPQFAQLFLIWSCMLGADLAMKSGGHIRVSALADMVPEGLQKAIVAFNTALILLFLIFIAILGWELAMSNWERELGASGLSYGIVTLAVPVGAALMIISLLRRLFAQGLLGLMKHDADVPEEIL